MAVRLREKRAQLGLTQDQVATKAGIGRPYLSQIESGEKIPAVDTFFELITKGLGMSIGGFFSPWLATEEVTNRQIQKESREMFNRLVGHDIARRGIWNYLKMLDMAFS